MQELRICTNHFFRRIFLRIHIERLLALLYFKQIKLKPCIRNLEYVQFLGGISEVFLKKIRRSQMYTVEEICRVRTKPMDWVKAVAFWE